MNRSGLVAGLVLCAAGSVAFASSLWSWVLNFDPGFVFNHEPLPTGSPTSSSVTILLIDGLRLDASRRMPTLNALRSRGADIEAQVGTPSFSRPGRATVAVGAPPAIHGVTTNRQKRAISLDNLIRRVGARGGTCRIAGSKIWSGLFGQDIERCGVYRADEAKEGPGAFVRQVPSVRASQEAGLAFVLEKPATLRIADIISTDFAAHEYGGASPEYLAEVQRADDLLGGLVKKLDLFRETLVVTADHGHRDVGGHGGEEREVLAIPIVMVGAGVRPATTASAHQADIAPTVAALLGAALPAGTSGRPIVSVLLADDQKLSLLKGASATQKEAFDKAVAARLGVRSAPNGSSEWLDLVFAQRDAERQLRAAVAVFLAVLIMSFTLTAIHFARPGASGLSAGVLAGLIALLGPARSRIPAMSFSAINCDEMLIPFFERIVLLAAVTALVAMSAALLAGRLLRRPGSESASISLAGSTGLVGSAALAVATIGWWMRSVLLSPFTLPEPGRLVEAYALTLSVASVSLTSLLMMAILRLVDVRKR